MGNRCHERRETLSSFRCHLGSKFDEFMTVPCFVRRQFNNLVGNIFFVATSDEVQYKFHVKKGNSKTHVFGSGYQKFLHDYDLKVGDSMMIDFENAPELFGIIPEGADGIEKHRVEEIPTLVVHTEGVMLTTGQTLKKQQLLRERSLGIGVVFVHTLTKTDVKGNELRIPKEVVRSLNIFESGEACFYVDDYGYRPKGAYYTTTDGRLKFDSCWSEFVKEYKFEAGNVVLILFHLGGSGVINVSVDII
ncbi:hypothetical protein ACQ4PT_008814 [Festuca glaucescens]